MVLYRHDCVYTTSGLFLCSWCVPCSSSAHRAPGKKAVVPIYKVLVRRGRETNSRPTNTEADALTTRPRACYRYLSTLSRMKLFQGTRRAQRGRHARQSKPQAVPPDKRGNSSAQITADTSSRTAISNGNSLLSQKLYCHCLNQGRTLNDLF